MPDAMRVAISGWFAGRAVGSGQYTDRLVSTLRHGSTAGERFDLVAPTRRGGSQAKLAFEQLHFPWSARGAHVAHVPYWAPPLASAAPVVVTVHDLIPLALPAYHRRLAVRAYNHLVARTTRRAAAVLADSEHTAADVRHRLCVDPDRIHVVPLGVDARFRPDVARAGHELPDRYGLYLGGFDERKNLTALLVAWRVVHAATGAPLVLAGRLPDPGDRLSPHPEALARRVGLPPEALVCMGFVSEEDKPGVYAGAAVFAFPSRYEGFGLPPLEAMACGVPVVVADATSLPEVVGDAGLCIGPDDHHGWVSAITAVLEDGTLATRLRTAGPTRAASFTWDRTAARTRAVYEAVAEASAARHSL